MLNKVEIMGRFTADPVLTMVNGATPVVNFSLAVQRDRKKEDGTRDADFIDCSAWRTSAEFVAKNFVKGQLAVVVGRIQTRKWLDMENETRYRTEVLVESIYFAGTKSDAQQTAQAPTAAAGYCTPLLEELGDGEELPF